MKTKYIVIGFIALFLVGGAIAETLREITVSKETYTALTTSATKDSMTPEQKAGSLLDEAISEKVKVQQQQEMVQLMKQCIEKDRLPACVDALRTATQ